MSEKLLEMTLLFVIIMFFILWEYKKPARRNKLKLSRLDCIAVINTTLFSFVGKLLIQPNQSLIDGAIFASWSMPAKYAGAIFLVDFILYWAHRFMHSKWLWQTHHFHHSVHELDWLKGLYTSGSHLLMYLIPQLVVGYFLFGFSRVEMISLFTLAYFVQMWQHANIRVPMGYLRYIFVSPQSHRLHHAKQRAYYNSNYGAIFSFWDVMFGTYQEPLSEAYSLGSDLKKPLLSSLIGY